MARKRTDLSEHLEVFSRLMKERDPKKTTEIFFRFMFERVGRNPSMWLRTAKRLRRAADILFPITEREMIQFEKFEPGDDLEPSIGGVYMLLVGLTIENLIKGIYVAGDSHIIENARLSRLKEHDLHKLLKHGGVSLSQNESELIERLQRFVTWAGRYPIPLDYKNLLPRPQGGPQAYVFSKDLTLLKQLMDRLQDMLERALADQNEK